MENIRVNLAKFGGSSLANFSAMDRSAATVLERPNTRIVVLSASSGVTDLLINIAETEVAAEREQLLSQIKAIQFEILQHLPHNPDLVKKIHKLLDNIQQLAEIAQLATSTALLDEIVSHGELMSTLLFCAVLQHKTKRPIIWFDARDIMCTDESFTKAIPDERQIAQLTQQHLIPLLKNSQSIIITQGFIGRTRENKTTTLGRGGSDYSAALIGAALQVDQIDIWTDVAGIYTIDPRIITDAQAIASISFAEAAEMATFGAKILHPATLIPAIKNNIPVHIGSSKNPNATGTIITAIAQETPPFRAIATRKKQTLITLHSLNMLHARGFLAAIFDTLAKHGVSVDLITTSEVKVALTLDHQGSSNYGKQLLTQALLSDLSMLCRVEVQENLALIAIIGNKLNETQGAIQEVFNSLNTIKIKMVCLGASSHNICLLIQEDQLSEAVTLLHSRLFTH